MANGARYSEGIQETAGLILIAIAVSIACGLVIARHAKSSPASAWLDHPNSLLRWFYRFCLGAVCYLPAFTVISLILTSTDCCHAAFRAVFETLSYRMSQAFMVALPVPLAIAFYFYGAWEIRRKAKDGSTRTG